MARPERFELPTSWFVATHSIQLSYGRVPRRLRILPRQKRRFDPWPVRNIVWQKRRDPNPQRPYFSGDVSVVLLCHLSPDWSWPICENLKRQSRKCYGTLARLLDSIHCVISSLNKFFGCQTIVWIERNADACADFHLTFSRFDRLAYILKN